MLVTVVLCLIYTLSCASIGVGLLRVIGISKARWCDFSTAAVLATVLLLGQGLLASTWLALGLAGKFSISIIVALLVLCLLIGIAILRMEIVAISRRLWSQTFSHLFGLPVPIMILAVSTLLVVCVLGIFNTILPVRFGAGDGIFFYMVLPKVMAASQQLFPIAGYEYTHGVSGFLGEMHHAALLALNGEQAALLFVWVTTLSMIALLVGLCGHLGVGRIGKWIAVAMMLSSTAVSFYLIDGKVDLFASAMGMAALYWALQAERRDVRVAAICLAGLFTGLAVVGKATYLLAVALPVVVLLLWNGACDMKNIALFTACAALPFLTHITKNFIFFTEPFAPFLFIDPQVGAAYRSQAYWNPLMVTRQIQLTYPLALAYGDYLFQYGNISGLYIAMVPLALFVPGQLWRRHKQLVRFTIVVLATVIISAVTQASFFAPRFILPALLALTPVLAFAAEHVFKASAEYIWFRAIVVICVVIALIGYSTIEQDFKRVLRYKIHGNGICDLEGFPLPECHDMLALNGLAVSGDRIFTTNLYNYWLRSDLIQCLANADELRLLSGSVNDVERLHDLGFKYIENKGEPWDLLKVPDDLSASQVYSRGSVELSNAVQIYELHANDQNRHPMYACMRGDAPAWDVVALVP